MSTGTTADFVVTRNDIIASAMRKLKAWPEDGNPPSHKIREAIRALNLILRRESLKQSGLAKSMWALDTNAILLSVGGGIYDSVEGLSESIQEIESAVRRDTSGADTPLEIIHSDSYAKLDPKNETGDPLKVFLERKRLLADQKLFVWPLPTSIGTTSSVVQGEVTYSCILKHTSATINKPGTGASWRLYWNAGDVATGSADSWVTATSYTNGSLIILTYKRPLYDFDSQYDNPDFPQGWEDYLIYKLAVLLAPEYDISLESKNSLKQDLADITAELFPASRENTTDYHNKASYY